MLALCLVDLGNRLVVELSAVAGVSVQTIYAIEQGRSVGSVRTMHAIAPTVGVPIAELVDFVVPVPGRG